LARNRIAALFRIETFESPAEIPRLTRGLAGLLPRGEEPELRQTVNVWLAALLRRNFPGVTIPETVDLEEVPMFDETVREWEKKFLKEGRQKGLIEGMQKVLLRQMTLRFGRLPQDVRRQVEQIASVQRLEELTQRVLGAKSLREMGLR
jgi:hypothetical protein